MSLGPVGTVGAPLFSAPHRLLHLLLRLQLRLRLRQLPLTLGSKLPVAHTRSYCEREDVVLE